MTGSLLTAKKISSHPLKLMKAVQENVQQYDDHDFVYFWVEVSSTPSGRNSSSGTGVPNHIVDEDTDGGKIAS